MEYNTETITSSLDTIIYVVLGIMAVAISGMLIFIIYMRIQYKHTIIVRDILDKRKIVFVDKFREYKDRKTGVKWYKLLKFKEQIPVAPREALEVGSKGKLFCETYRLPTGEYIYLQDKTDLNKLDTDENFKPITTSQRVIQYHLFEGKMKFKRKSWKDLIMPIAALVSVTMIVLMLMVFYGDMAKPLLEMGDKQAAITQKQADITETLNQIIQKEQLIKDGNPQNPPPN